MENPILFLVLIYAAVVLLFLGWPAMNWIYVVWNPSETNLWIARESLSALAIAPIWPLFALVVIGIWVFRLIKLIVREAQ